MKCSLFSRKRLMEVEQTQQTQGMKGTQKKQTEVRAKPTAHGHQQQHQQNQVPQRTATHNNKRH